MCIQIVHNLQSIYFKDVVVAFLRFAFELSCIDRVVVVVKYGSFGFAISMNSGQPGRGEERIALDEDNVINAVRGDAVGATRREETEDAGSDSRWTFAEYRRECGGMTNVRCLSAMAVHGEEFMLYDLISFQRNAAIGAWKRL